MELDYLTINEAAQLLNEKKVSSAELTQHCIKNIKQKNAEVNAFLTITEDKALNSAKESDERRSRGELKSNIDGIPGSLKDVICTAGVRTTAASKMLDNFIPPYDAHVTRLLKDAGAVIVGKTNLDEFAMGTTTAYSAYNMTKNPWDTSRVVGGSSGGSAASVAADQSIFSLGTDTGGSIRLPASWTNTVGLRPTYGRVSRNGVIAMASSLDQVGTFTRSVADAAELLRILAEPDTGDSTSYKIPVPNYVAAIGKDIKGMKIGVVKEFMGEAVDVKIREAVNAAIRQFEKLGAEIIDISVPLAEESLATYMVIVPSEVSTNLERYDGIKYGVSANEDANVDNLIEVYYKSRQKFGNEAKRRIMLGSFALSAGFYDQYYNRARKVQRMIKAQFSEKFKEVDVMVGPVSPTMPFKTNEDLNDSLKLWMADLLVVPVNVANLCGISVPCGFEQGLPIGMQIIANHFDEEKLFKVASAFEVSTEWHKINAKSKIQN
jgi:aspartyl-tRNA(Asn)/glutamyl-tRNA(Gln) amidotransferase subunit A